jgi:hypothetical protein
MRKETKEAIDKASAMAAQDGVVLIVVALAEKTEVYSTITPELAAEALVALTDGRLAC